MRYTVAFAVFTPPQITFALFTFRLSPEPVTVTAYFSTVVCSPTTADGSSWPGTTW
jgi:hypothetical protein